MDKRQLQKLVQGKRVLVTGGTGSIGSELVRQLLEGNPEQVRVFSRDEYKQHVMARTHVKERRLRFLVGDVRDKERLQKALEGVDHVFHAAALKHVNSSEYNPFEAVQTNVVGTQNLVEACLKCGVSRLVVISTDKAVAPLNVMGATKLLSEKITASTIYHQGNKPLLASVVRFGNVLGSRGSVLETFADQLDKGEQITITHPEMTRFVMSVQEAVSLVLTAFHNMLGSEIFVLKMPVVRIMDLAKAFVEVRAKERNLDPKKVQFINTGIKPGEKLHELLMTEDESRVALETSEMFILRPFLQFPELGDTGQRSYAQSQPAKIGSYSSESQPPLSTGDVEKLLKQSNCMPRP